MCSISTSPDHSSSYSSYSSYPPKDPLVWHLLPFPGWLSVIPYLADHFPPWARRNPHLLAEQQSSHGMVTLLIICSMSFLGPKKTPIVEYQEIDGDVRYICFCWGFGDGDPRWCCQKNLWDLQSCFFVKSGWKPSTSTATSRSCSKVRMARPSKGKEQQNQLRMGACIQ